MTDDTTIFDTSKELLACITSALETANYHALPCRICVVPGEIAWDNCNAGQLVVSVTREFQSETFPLEALERGVNSSCGLPYLVAELTFSLLRCAPIPRGTSVVVPCEELEATALLIRKDAFWMRQALSCCLRDLKINRDILDYIVNSTETVGPEGACVGNEIVVLIGFING